MSKVISIIDSNKNFTPLVFYNEFLNKLAEHYRENGSDEIVFKLFEKGDNDIYNSIYRIDPIAVPLLLSILEQLSKFHSKPLQLLLNNNRATIPALEFLFRANFFKTAGGNEYYNQSGSNIIQFSDAYLGAFKGKEIRKDHIIRAYKKSDYANINFEVISGTDEIALRDTINSLTSYNVQKHFAELLFENDNTSYLHNTYIDILSELITNGVIHSESTSYAMMFVDKYRTKFSISDNGVGLKNSLNAKKDFPFYYYKNSFRESITYANTVFNENLVDNLKDIFETLYYSALKERKGLFDLMLNVVLHSNGYFRLHCDNCQIIVSNRIFKHITHLAKTREEIFSIHNLFELGKLEISEYQPQILNYAKEIKQEFVQLFSNMLDYYSEETRYSSIRFYNVKFRGVHIEVEIPTS